MINLATRCGQLELGAKNTKTNGATMGRCLRTRLFALALSILCVPMALAQSFPAKPLKIIVTLAAGAQTDRLARALAQEISQSVGQPVVVENKPGAGSIIGMLALAKSPPDGHTVVITTAEPLIYNPLLYKRLPYDADNDFSYVTQLTRNLGVIVANRDVPGNTFPEVIAYARANPGKLNWATWGPGSTPAIYLEWIKKQNGVDIAAIPYKGTAPTLPAILSGEIGLTYLAIGTAAPLVQSGKLKPLAITGANNSAVLPNVRSLSEYKSDPYLTSEFHVYAPAKTPNATLERLSTEFSKALRTPLLEKLMANTMLPVGSSPAEFGASLKTKKVEAAKLFQALQIRPADAPQ